MPNHHVSSAKIVATPTETAWSQAYHAGSLFAVLSLTQDAPKEEQSLHAIGREFFNILESEFFALEEKSLASIKHGLLQALHDVPDDLTISLTVAFVKDTTLYVFLLGTGAIKLKRGGAVGTLLSHLESAPKDRKIHAASGHLEDHDTVALMTEQLIASVPKETLTEALEQPGPSDTSELLAPLIHDKEVGGAAGLFLSYSAPDTKDEAVEDPEREAEVTKTASIAEKTEDEEIEKKGESEAVEERDEREDEEEALYRSRRASRLSDADSAEETAVTIRQESFFAGILQRLPRVTLGISHKRKVFLSVAAIILVVLAGSIFFTMQKKEAAKVEAAFNEVYPQAQKYYDEGQGLKNLNATLAQDDFRKAKTLLEDNREKFKEGSKEREQIDALLANINREISGEPTESATVNEASSDASPPLTAVKDQEDALGVTSDERGVYVLTEDAVLRVSGSTQEMIENDNDWSRAVGLSAYSGNIYILDRAEGILKFVAGDDGFGRQSYFTGDAPDMGKAVDLAIDSSVYVLSSDGTISKFTRGQTDTFRLSGLAKPLSSPTSIFTNADTDNIYVLDNGNARIVKLSKEGTFLGQYAAEVLKNARYLDVAESDKKAYVLSDDKVYEVVID